MGFKPRMRKCGYLSKKRKTHWFKAMFKEQKYCSKRCRNAAAQQRVRERSQKFYELQAEQDGPLGVSANG